MKFYNLIVFVINSVVIKEYYSKYLKIYLDRHNGLKYSKITLVQKELDFLAEHETLIRVLWEKCTPLQKYSQLFEYASEAESDYESFLHRRNSEIERERDGNDNSKSISNRTIIQNGERSVYIENNIGNVTIK